MFKIKLELSYTFNEIDEIFIDYIHRFGGRREDMTNTKQLPKKPLLLGRINYLKLYYNCFGAI